MGPRSPARSRREQGTSTVWQRGSFWDGDVTPTARAPRGHENLRMGTGEAGVSKRPPLACDPTQDLCPIACLGQGKALQTSLGRPGALGPMGK